MRSLLNIIFLATSILSCIKILSTKSIPSAIIPFLMVIGIGLIMDLIEEIKRYRNDLVTNSSSTKIYKTQKFQNIKWSDIKVGNLIKVKKNEIIPADLFVICSSNTDTSFYLQTSNIDGESNLKKREVLISTQKIFYKNNIKEKNYLEKAFNAFNNLGEENCYINVEPPNRNIYKINGLLFLNGEKRVFNKSNVAIRGAILKNTKFIYGIIIYTGEETKIMQNFIKPKSKFSYLDKLVNDICLVIIIVRILYVLIFMGIGLYYRYKYMPNYENNKLGYEYLLYYRHFNGKNEKNNSLENVKYFTAHFILSQLLLPTSVAVLLAVIKVIQSLFLEHLEKSLRKKPGQKMKCFSSELLGDLGSVKYIFCDKTGTLTKNQTQFRACSIFTSLFDESSGKSQTEYNSTQTQNRLHSNYNSSKSKTFLSTYSTYFSLDFNYNSLMDKLKLKNIPLDVKNIENCPFNNQGEAMEEFVLNMALNHDIVVDNYKNGYDKKIKFQGTNPDEITLVGAAGQLGYLFTGKKKNIITVRRIIFSQDGKKENNEIKRYQELLKIPFRSERKRSTIIVRDLKTNKIKLYLKGSDSKIFKKINSYSQESILEITKEHIDNFARSGLRTLSYAFKIIPENIFISWLGRYNKVKQSFSADKEKLEEDLIEEIEKDCYLLGATALEDQMQDNVKKDIQEFIEAGINFWMLTGDKMETSESIGYGIKLFDADTEVFKIKNGNGEEEVIKRLKEIEEKIKEIQSDLSKITIGNGHSNKEKKKDFNTNLNLFEKRIKNNIKEIYDEKEEEENDNQIQVNKKDLYGSHKSLNEMLENGSDIMTLENKNKNKELNSANEGLKNINQIISNFRNKELNKDKRREVENMSIFRFMVDNQYFENSNLDFENNSIFKNKVEHPNLVYSFDSEKSDCKPTNEENNEVNENEGNNKPNMAEIPHKPTKILIKRDKKLDNTNVNSKDSDLQNETEKNLLKKKKRKKINLPIKESDFLDYFDKCISKLRELFYIQQKSFFLFKIPYLYGLINIEKDPLTEDIKNQHWKEKLNLKKYLMEIKIKYSLIIHGECIKYCISEKASDLFWFLIQHSRSIICCGCSPIEKAQIVKFVKNHTKETTLAIGDGENDVNMIKEADVGIGIFGKEGSQAAFNSDYAFSEFQYLKQLLFIHGRFILLRNTYFLNMFFFKNFVYSFFGIIMTFYSLYSGTFFYDEFYDTMFNTFVSIFPIIAFAVIDEDFNPDYGSDNSKKKIGYLLPDMYKQTRDSKPFNIIKYLITTLTALILDIIVFATLKTSFSNTIKNSKGDISSSPELIFLTYLTVLITHFIMVYIDSSLFNYIILIIFIVQIILDVALITIMNTINDDSKLSGIIYELMSHINFLTIFMTCTIICLPFYILRRLELYFGINISNFIKIENINEILEGKFYRKKISQMIRALSAVNKFKRIQEELSLDIRTKYDNLNDINMEKVVMHFKKAESDKEKVKMLP